MTITTAKLALVAALAVLGAPAWAQLQPGLETAEKDKPREGWRFTPTIELRQTWTDNVGLAPDADAQSQFVTEIAPGLLLDYIGPRVKLRSRAELHYYAMADREASGANRSSKLLDADLQARLLGDFLFLDAQAGISQQGVSPFGQRVYDNGYTSANRAEVKTWRVSPYLKQRIGNIAVGELRYTRDSVRSDSKTGFGNSDGDTIAASLRSGGSQRTIGWSASYLRQQIDDSRAQESQIENVNVGLSWRVAPTLALTAGAGHDKYDYQSLGGVTEGRSWTAGLNWNPSRRTSLNAEVGHRFFGPTRALALLHRSRNTVWNVNYSDSVTNSRNEYLLPATLDTAAMLDRLFLPNYSDPIERQRAVDDYIRNTGLPPALANNLNFFSNRFFLQKQFRLGSALRLARTSAVLSVYHTKRDALSVRDPDTVLLGSIFDTANDNVTQRGGNLTVNWRYTPRTTLNFVVDRSRSSSRSAVLETHNNFMAIGARYTGPKNLAGALQLRRVSGSTAGLTNFDFTENAISASVYMKY